MAANAYGQTTLADLRGRQELTQDFGKITLRDLAGSVTVVARYADLTASGLTADFKCEANKSAVELLDLGGNVKLYNQFGSVRVRPAVGLRQLGRGGGAHRSGAQRAPARAVCLPAERAAGQPERAR
ncbi:MAG: hypothetical protein WKG07_09065 [Hymenobacter sp.]